MVEYKSLAIGVVIALVAVAGVIGTVAIIDMTQANGSANAESGTPTPTKQPVSVDEVPEAVANSKPGAEQLKRELVSNGFENATLYITERGDIVVRYVSDATHGPDLKTEMGQVAILYADVVGSHNETGGLTVQANGVDLLVSSDSAEAYDNGDINEEAFKETFAWQTAESSGSEGGD